MAPACMSSRGRCDRAAACVPSRGPFNCAVDLHTCSPCARLCHSMCRSPSVVDRNAQWQMHVPSRDNERTPINVHCLQFNVQRARKCAERRAPSAGRRLRGLRGTTFAIASLPWPTHCCAMCSESRSGSCRRSLGASARRPRGRRHRWRKESAPAGHRAALHVEAPSSL